MRRLTVHSRFARRALSSCLLGLYALVSLLGSGGLHALMPHECCLHTHDSPQAAVPHRHACGHAHHHHASTADDQDQRPDSSPLPAPCDPEHCLICKHSLTPAVATTMVEPIVADVLVTCCSSRAPPSVASAASYRFLIRGPPTA